MKKYWLIGVFLLVLTLAGCGNNGSLTVTDAWSRSLPASADTGAMYLTITNHSGQDDVLTAVSVSVAKMAELHRSTMTGDVMKMEPLPGGVVDIPNDETVIFEPGGLHVMLMGLTAPLTAGESFSATLHFQNAEDIAVTVFVKE